MSRELHCLSVLVISIAPSDYPQMMMIAHKSNVSLRITTCSASWEDLKPFTVVFANGSI